MSWRRLRVYLKELFVSALAFFAVFVGLAIIAMEYGIYSFILSSLLSIPFFIWMICYEMQFVPFSIKVLKDFLFKEYITQQAYFVSQKTFKSSDMLNTTTYSKENGVMRSGKQYYYSLITAKIEDEEFHFTSSEYFDLEQNEEYIFTYCKRSKAILNITFCNGESVPITKSLIIYKNK